MLQCFCWCWLTLFISGCNGVANVDWLCRCLVDVWLLRQRDCAIEWLCIFSGNMLLVVWIEYIYFWLIWYSSFIRNYHCFLASLNKRSYQLTVLFKSAYFSVYLWLSGSQYFVCLFIKKILCGNLVKKSFINMMINKHTKYTGSEATSRLLNEHC